VAVRPRRYDDPCGVARALGAVGERWALLVVRELLLGPKRFGDLSRGLPGMSQNVLSQRLRDLERAGIVERARLGPPASASVYQLTERGKGLEPVLLALAYWGSHLPLKSTAELSTDALILALRTTFDDTGVGGGEGLFALELGDDRLLFEASDGTCRVTRAGPSEAASGEPADHQSVRATLRCDPWILRALVFGELRLDDTLRRGAVAVTGDVAAVRRLVRSFSRPQAVA
jgi:DNA-binding HxlR family transcriptional regulator